MCKMRLCYSCHWKRELIEKIELRDNLKDFYLSLSKANKDDHHKQKVQQAGTTGQDLTTEKWGH